MCLPLPMLCFYVCIKLDLEGFCNALVCNLARTRDIIG